MTFTLSMGGMCKKWASTDEGGEGDVNCLYQAGDNTFKV